MKNKIKAVLLLVVVCTLATCTQGNGQLTFGGSKATLLLLFPIKNLNLLGDPICPKALQYLGKINGKLFFYDNQFQKVSDNLNPSLFSFQWPILC